MAQLASEVACTKSLGVTLCSQYIMHGTLHSPVSPLAKGTYACVYIDTLFLFPSFLRVVLPPA
jgi:hypothetical protein